MRISFLLLLTILTTFICPSGVGAQADSSADEAWMPYVPTRIEWLALEMNARLRVDLSLETKYMMVFGPAIDDGQVVLCIYVSYLPTVNREVMNMAIENAKRMIERTADSKNWSSWLKVKEEIEIVDLNDD